jgi:hypothetical protein
MNITLYDIAQEYREAAAKLEDLDLDEQTLADTLESISGAIEVKGQNVAAFIGNLEAQANAIKEAEARMSARRKAIENRAAGIRHYLLTSMQVAGITKIECAYFKIAVQDNPPAVVIDDASLLPPDYMRQPEPPPPAADKKLIAQAIKDGFEVPGAHLERSKRLSIK